MRKEYEKFPISEEISEEGGAMATFVNKVTVALDGAIDDAIAGNYCIGNKALVRNLFFGLMKSIADNIMKDGRPRQIGNFITIYPVPTGEIDLEKGWDREKNGIKIRARLLNEMKVNTDGWTFVDVTPGKKPFTLQSVKAGEEIGVYDVSKLGEINGKNLPSTEAGEPLEVHWEVEGTDKSGDIAVDKLSSSVSRIDIAAGALAGLTEDDDGKTLVLTVRGNFSSGKIAAKVKYAEKKRITIERCDSYTDSEFAAIGDNFDGATGYRVEDGKRYVKGKYQVLEDPEVEIELWQDEDTDEPRIWHSNDTGSALSGTSFTFKLTADPAKPDFVQETVTYEGTVS